MIATTILVEHFNENLLMMCCAGAVEENRRRKSNERRVTRRSQKSTEERERQACFENISTKCPKTDGAQQRAGKISEG